MDILALLGCLSPCLSTTTVRQLNRIILALLRMSGRVTMVGIARWTGAGGSYRTVQRFFATTVPWTQVLWLFVRQHLLQPNEVYLLAGDECVVTKAGKTTFGLDRFFSGIYQKPVPGVAFFSLALISTTTRRAVPLRMEQVVRTAAEKAAAKASASAKRAKGSAPTRKPGRPKGSTTTTTAAVALSPELQRIQTMVQAQLQLIARVVPVVYLVLDGHFGNSSALQMVRQCGLHLISKLRSDAALYLPYDGPYQGRGPRRKYGSKVDYRRIPVQYLTQTFVEEQIETRTYQAILLQKACPQPLNVVIIEKINRRTQARAHVVMFSSDLTLAADRLIDNYRLRFQIEFTFRDAKQYWGLEDFMNVTATGVSNAANLSILMVNVASVLLHDARRSDREESVLDLKAQYHGFMYVSETIKLLPEKPDEVLIDQIFRQVACLGRIHPAQPHLKAA